MGLAEVKQEVLAEAENLAKTILAEAGDEAEKLRQSAQKETMEFKKQAKVKGLAQAISEQRAVLASAKLKSQTLISNAQQMAWENLKQATCNNLTKSKDKDRAELLGFLLKKAQKEITVGRVFVSKQDKKLLKGKFIVAEADIEGGLLAETKDGLISVNLSLAEMLDRVREQDSAEISEVLYG